MINTHICSVIFLFVYGQTTHNKILFSEHRINPKMMGKVPVNIQLFQLVTRKLCLCPNKFFQNRDPRITYVSIPILIKIGIENIFLKISGICKMYAIQMYSMIGSLVYRIVINGCVSSVTLKGPMQGTYCQRRAILSARQ